MSGMLANKVALVTGSTRGFGRATVMRLAEEGADVCINYYPPSARNDANEAASAIEQLGRHVNVVGADITDHEQATRLVEETIAYHGKIDILVNNAGVLYKGPFMDQTRDTWEHMIRVNVQGALDMTALVLPLMRERGEGTIVNIASQLAHVGGEDFAVYSGTKSFLLAYTKSLAREVGPYGIRVNAVCPGSIMTDMNLEFYEPEKKASELPLRRLGETVDVANAVFFFVSPLSKFVTGQCVDVNGGAIMA